MVINFNVLYDYQFSWFLIYMVINFNVLFGYQF